ncbi:hypothetical protein K431DRAFT_312910 [Polychaeton citri CBS 116435]|uniref:Tho complex subunit 7 n=1 Tax=Polychaeton citri CBS 116435 TaxID=1314669 RepID=A0A9P4QAD2_9PEZI|nr:hypothetical protein K431DRAFT_312910 [Polychaeton citri CBS 116435]
MAQNGQFRYELISDSKIEDELHVARLLNVEERPFGRVTGSLLGDRSLLRSKPYESHLPSPPPDGEQQQVPLEEFSKRSERFREEVLLDFQALENSLVRMQLIQSSNARERERYASEKAKILAAAQQVRENTLELRTQLTEAQKVLGLRKGYDRLAEKILEDKKLKSRDDAQSDIEALEKEIEDLEMESKEFEGVWTGRLGQFERVVAEGETMRKLIKGIKDEPDEEMEGTEDGNGEEGAEEGDGLSKEDLSRIGTPRLDAATPRGIDGGDTPMPETSDANEDADTGATASRPHNRFLEVDDANRVSSRIGSPRHQPTESSTDIEMGESAAVPEAQLQTPTADDSATGTQEEMDEK